MDFIVSMYSSFKLKSPHQRLMQMVRVKDVNGIRKLIENDKGKTLLLHEYDRHGGKTILQIACSTEITGVDAKVIKTLLQLGTDPCAYTYADKIPPWHYAALNGNLSVLSCLLDKFTDKNKINMISKGNAVLHLVIEHIVDKQELIVDCLKVLKEKNININIINNKNKTLVLLAAEKGYKTVIQYIITNYAEEIELDSYKNEKGETARDIIMKENLYAETLPEPKEALDCNDNIEVRLEQYLKKVQEEEFVNLINSNLLGNEQIKNVCTRKIEGCKTFLQFACEHNLLKVVDCLLKKGISPNCEKNDTVDESPIVLAATNGNFAICASLINNENIMIPKELISAAIRSMPESENDRKLKNVFMQLLFTKIDESKCKDSYYNHVDYLKNTPLHYANRLRDEELVHKLLERGASLAIRNTFGEFAVTGMSAETLQMHLENNCFVQQPEESKVLAYDDNEPKEPYQWVTFKYRTLISRRDCAETKSDPEQRDAPEMDLISFLAKSSEFKSLLTHPVISTFVFMKWYRIKKWYYCNLALFALFFVSMISYLASMYLKATANRINATLVALCVSLFALTVRESLQLFTKPTAYFTHKTNWLEVSMITCVTWAIFAGPQSDHCFKNLWAISILLTSFVFVIMIGQTPLFAEYMTMLLRVSVNFLSFFLKNSILICSFALSFFILFHKNDNDANAEGDGQNSNNTAENETDYYSNIFLTLFKTLVMLTGEFEAGELPFDESNEVVGRIVFMFFLMIVAIVLLNLLNGLAVSDTQEIRNDAQLFTQIARTEQVAYYENVMTKNAPEFWQSFPACTKLFGINVNATCAYFARSVSLFPDFLPDRQLMLCISSDRCHVLQKSRIEGRQLDYWRIGIEQSTVQQVRACIQRKNARERDSNEQETMQCILHKLQAIEERFQMLAAQIEMRN